MAYLILQTQTIPDWNQGGSTAKLRIFASQAFYEATTGAYIPQGQVGNIHSACQIVNCTVSSTTLTIPEVTLATTTDSTVPNATYTCVLYNSRGVASYTLLSQAFVDPSYFQTPAESSVLVASAGTTSVNAYYTFRGTSAGYDYYNVVGETSSTTVSAVVNTGAQWRIYDSAGTNKYHTSDNPNSPWDGTWVVTGGATSPAPTVSESELTVTSTWEQLTLSNQASATVGAPFQWNAPFWDVTQTKEYVNNLVGNGTTPYSAELTAGKTRLSADPLLPQVPIAVGTNDPRWNIFTNQKYLSIDYANSLATAIADIGSTPTQLFVSEASSAISTDEATPSTLLLTFIDTGSLSVNSGKTVRIALMSPTPSQQIFTGSGDVHLEKNAVAEKDLSWWAGNSSTADLTSQFGQMLMNGGRCFVPAGIWKCTNITIPSYTILRGAGGSGDATNGTVITLYNLAATSCVLKANEAFRFITVKDLTISTSSSTTASGFIAQGTTPNTATYLLLDNVAFYGTGASAPAQFYLKDIGAAQWQLEECYLNHCAWVTPVGGKGITIESVNTSVTVIQGLFGCSANATAIYGYHIGFLTLIQCQAAGVGLSAVPYATSTNRTITQASITIGTKDLTISTGAFSQNDIGRPVFISGKLDSYIDGITSASAATVHDAASATATNASMTVKQYDATTARGNAFVHIVNSHGNIQMINCVDEGMSYFILNDASDPNGVIQLTNCWLQSWVQLNQTCTLNVDGCHLSSQTFRDGVSAAGRIMLKGNYMDKDALPVITGGLVPVLLQPTFWGVHSGVTLVQTQFDNDEGVFRQQIGLPTDFKFGNDFITAASLTTPVISIGSSIDTTGGPHKKLLRWGRLDSVTEVFDFYYQLERDFDNGLTNFTGNQALPNRGYNFDASVLATTFVSGGVNAPSITTDAGTLYPGVDNQCVRMTSNANHTIGGLNMAPVLVEPGTANEQVWLWNIGAFNITFLHQSGGAVANERFICDGGVNLVCAPNEIVHVVRDGTQARWRTSKFNITGLTSDGVTLTSTLPTVVGASLVINGGSALDTSSYTGSGDLVRKGAPTLVTPNIGVATGNSLAVSGLLKSSSATAGVGYATGAGGTVVQGTSRTTTVVLNKVCGTITLFSAAGSATPASFTVTNSAVSAATDVVHVVQKSGTDKYAAVVSAVGAGSFEITFWDLTGTTTETPAFSFAVLKAVAA